MSECVVRMDIDEMPTACGPCKLSCTAICKEWMKVDRKEIGRTKSPNCPILAILPENHGRLVDAEQLRQVLVVYKETDALGHTPLQLCDAMPTIIPATERSEA